MGDAGDEGELILLLADQRVRHAVEHARDRAQLRGPRGPGARGLVDAREALDGPLELRQRGMDEALQGDERRHDRYRGEQGDPDTQHVRRRVPGDGLAHRGLGLPAILVDEVLEARHRGVEQGRGGPDGFARRHAAQGSLGGEVFVHALVHLVQQQLLLPAADVFADLDEAPLRAGDDRPQRRAGVLGGRERALRRRQREIAEAVVLRQMLLQLHRQSYALDAVVNEARRPVQERGEQAHSRC
ncbi:hypothetical protein WME93_44335 [Sorangium sp. So ce1000]